MKNNNNDKGTNNQIGIVQDQKSDNADKNSLFNDEIIDLIKDNIEEQSEVNLDSILTIDLGIDSLSMIMIVDALEYKYSIQIDETEFQDIETVSDIIKKLKAEYPELTGE